MLVLTRKLGEAIKIGDKIRIVVVSIDGGNVKIGVEAPHDVAVHREEVYQRIVSVNREASEQLDISKAKALKGILSERTKAQKPKAAASSNRKLPQRKKDV